MKFISAIFDAMDRVVYRMSEGQLLACWALSIALTVVCMFIFLISVSGILCK
jgi:hypothetical protein